MREQGRNLPRTGSRTGACAAGKLASFGAFRPATDYWLPTTGYHHLASFHQGPALVPSAITRYLHDTCHRNRSLTNWVCLARKPRGESHAPAPRPLSKLGSFDKAASSWHLKPQTRYSSPSHYCDSGHNKNGGPQSRKALRPKETQETKERDKQRWLASSVSSYGPCVLCGSLLGAVVIPIAAPAARGHASIVHRRRPTAVCFIKINILVGIARAGRRR